jgi:PAS domain S-box-containing protein
MTEFVSLLEFVGYVLLFLTLFRSARDGFRTRDPHQIDILLVVVVLASERFVAQPRWPSALYLGLLLHVALPFLFLRLVTHFRAVSRLWHVLAVGIVGASGVIYFVLGLDPLGRTHTSLYALSSGLLVVPGVALALEVPATAGVTKWRLSLAGAGAFAIAGTALVGTAIPYDYRLVQGLWGAALALFSLAFGTPQFLKRRWQKSEHAKYLSQSAGLDPLARGEHAAEQLRDAAASSVGNAAVLVALRDAPGAVTLTVQAASDPALLGLVIEPGGGLVDRSQERGGARMGVPADCEPAIREWCARLGSSVLVAPIASHSRSWGVVLVVQRRGSLFPEDDLALLEQLGLFCATALDHAHLVAQERERVRQAADRKLREVETQMSLMLDSIKDYAMFILDHRGRVVTWHIGAEHVFGYRAAEMHDESAAQLFGLAPGDLSARLAEARRVGVAAWEAPCIRRDGARFVGATTVRTLEPGDDAVLGFAVVTRDVTERRDLEERLRQSQKMEAIGQLAGGVAHDFNNMLTAIIGYADWLDADLPAGDPHRPRVVEIQKAAERAAGLTRQLLTFSRRQILQASVLNLSRLVDDMLPMLRRVIGEHITVVHEGSAEIAAVVGDRSQVQQILLNLAVNGRDAMAGGGRMLIRTSNVWVDEALAAGEVLAGPHVCLEVRDTGTGMDEATQARIFEPFFTTKEPGQGTGLGLATVYGIVKQMSGIIRVSSVPGEGAIFRLYFPETHASEVLASTNVPAGTPGGSETILLVEDDEAVREFLAQTLERHGYHVLSADNQTAALALAQAHLEPIDLVVTDVVMPGGTGPELVRALEQLRPGIPALFISGYADGVLSRERTFPKASHFLQKPFAAGDFLIRIRQILSAP